MASWVPHGLIQKRILEGPYRDAKKAIDINGNSSDPAEFRTVKLWQDLFNKLLFSGDDFAVNSQQPLPGSDKACDVMVNYIDSNYEHHPLCFAECRRSKHITESKLRDLAVQAQGHCEAYLKADQTIATAYACTLVGPYVRCWSLRRGDAQMCGFWPGGDEKEEFAHYLDAGRDDHREVIQRSFGLMMSPL